MIKEAILQIYPPRDYSLEVTDVFYSVDINLTSTPLTPLPIPNFRHLGLNQNLIDLLKNRWIETQICLDSEAYLASIILMGSLLEGVLLTMLKKYPALTNQANKSPKDPSSGKVKPFLKWSLWNMIEVGSEVKWIKSDRAAFSHIVREFRNLVHPNEQVKEQLFPDKSTCDIRWRVITATCTDIVSWFLRQK